MSRVVLVASALWWLFPAFAQAEGNVAWQTHQYQKSYQANQTRQVDAYGTLYTNRTSYRHDTLDQYFVPHAVSPAYVPAVSPVVAPQVGVYQIAPVYPTTYVPRKGGVTPDMSKWAIGAAGDYGASGFYWDGRGNPISYAEFKRQLR